MNAEIKPEHSLSAKNVTTKSFKGWLPSSEQWQEVYREENNL